MKKLLLLPSLSPSFTVYFSHYDLSVSYPNVVVENVHLGDSLMSLGYRLRNQE